MAQLLIWLSHMGRTGSHRTIQEDSRPRTARWFAAAGLLLVAAAVVLTSIPGGSPTTPAVGAGLPEAAAGEPANADPEGRPVYPYSIIQGGATSVDELEKAMAADPVVAAHFEVFDLQKTRVETLPEHRVAHVSYRKGNDVFWTRKPVVIPAGETVLTDGSNVARTRCGNRLADSPGPVSGDEPDPTVFDTPGPAFRRETPPIRSVGPITSNGPSGSFSTSSTGESGPSDRPGPGGGVPGPGFGPPGSSSSGGHNPGPGGTTGNPNGGNGTTSNPNGAGGNSTASNPNSGGSDAGNGGTTGPGSGNSTTNPANSPGGGQPGNSGGSGNSGNPGAGPLDNAGGPRDPFETFPPLPGGSLPPIGDPDFPSPGSLTLAPGPPFSPDGPPGPGPTGLTAPPEGPANPLPQGPQGPKGDDSPDDPQSIPEPGTTVLVLLGGAYLARRVRRGAGR